MFHVKHHLILQANPHRKLVSYQKYKTQHPIKHIQTSYPNSSIPTHVSRETLVPSPWVDQLGNHPFHRAAYSNTKRPHQQKKNPHPTTSRGETVHFNPYLLRLNYPAVFHVKPLPHYAPTKRFTWNTEKHSNTRKHNPNPRQPRHTPPILQNKLYINMWSDADAFYKTQLQARRILLTKIPMFHVKHQTPQSNSIRLPQRPVGKTMPLTN